MVLMPELRIPSVQLNIESPDAMYVYVYVYIYIYIYMCVYTHMCIYIYIYMLLLSLVLLLSLLLLTKYTKLSLFTIGVYSYLPLNIEQLKKNQKSKYTYALFALFPRTSISRKTLENPFGLGGPPSPIAIIAIIYNSYW